MPKDGAIYTASYYASVDGEEVVATKKFEVKLERLTTTTVETTTGGNESSSDPNTQSQEASQGTTDPTADPSLNNPATTPAVSLLGASGSEVSSLTIRDYTSGNDWDIAESKSIDVNVSNMNIGENYYIEIEVKEGMYLSSLI